MRTKKSLRVLVVALAVVMVFEVMTTAFAQNDNIPNYFWAGRFPQVAQGGGVKSSVRLIQHYYNTRMYGGISEDGVFGSGTRDAVIALQRNLGLNPDGIVGSGTWNQMQSNTSITMWSGGNAYHGTPRHTGVFYDSQAYHGTSSVWYAVANGGQLYTIM